jgi:hypothetical protein
VHGPRRGSARTVVATPGTGAARAGEVALRRGGRAALGGGRGRRAKGGVRRGRVRSGLAGAERRRAWGAERARRGQGRAAPGCCHGRAERRRAGARGEFVGRGGAAPERRAMAADAMAASAPRRRAAGGIAPGREREGERRGRMGPGLTTGGRDADGERARGGQGERRRARAEE